MADFTRHTFISRRLTRNWAWNRCSVRFPSEVLSTGLYSALLGISSDLGSDLARNAYCQQHEDKMVVEGEHPS